MRLTISLMRALALVLALVVGPASAQMTLLGAGGTKAVSSGGGCSQATTFLARTSGLNGTETTAYTTLICGMVTDGTWSLLDALYIFATNTTTTANLNLVSTRFTLTANGTCTFTPDQGYACNGTTGYFNTGYTPSTSATNLTLNSASIGIYMLSATAVNNTVAMGIVQNAAQTLYLDPVATSTFAWELNGNTFPTVANTLPIGAWVASRNGSSTVTNLYKNGSTTPFGSSSGDTSVALPTTALFISACDCNGAAANFANYPITAAFIAGGLTATQAVAINNRINAFMTTFGHNVY